MNEQRALDESSDQSAAPGAFPVSGVRSASEAAAELGINERTIRRAIARGALPAAKRAGVWQIAAADFARFQATHLNTSRPAARRAIGRSEPRRSWPKVVALLPPPLPVLPVPLSPLIGREQEVAEVLALVRDAGARLLTLTGPGGVGKTRLALEVAARLRGAFDGIAFVPFDAVHEPALMLPTLARALGVGDRGSVPLLQRLQAAVRSRSLLLVLDNLEHLLPAASAIAEVLATCPRVAALVTSRAALRVSGERVFPVEPLSLPDTDRTLSLAEAAGSAAVALFVERAQAVAGDLHLTEANAAAVADICRRLDGLPLAIELAAAQTRVLPLTVLRARLADRLPLVGEGPRDQPDRLRTMRNAIAWSYDLLSPAEQRLFRGLSVFSGHCALEAAEAVAAEGGRRKAERDDASSAFRLATPPPSASVLDGIAALIDHSLVRRDETSDDEPRYRMLETIREYGLDALTEQGEEQAVRGAHAAYFLALAEQANPALRGPDQHAWLGRLEAEHGNLRAALGHFLESDAAAGLRLAAALGLFWQVRGYLGEGRRWLEALLANAPDGTAPRARALHASGQLARHQADIATGISLCEESLAIYRVLAEPRGVASVLRTLGHLVWDGGDLARGRALFEESLALSRAHGDDVGIATTLGGLGCLALVEADNQRAKACQEESLALFQRMGDQRSIAVALGNLGHVAWDDGDDARARTLFEENLTLSRELGNKRDVAYTVAWLGNLARSQGDARRASDMLAESLGLHAEIGDKLGISYCLCFRGVLAVQQGEHARGVRLMNAAAGLHTAFEYQLTPHERRDRETAMTAARAALGEGDFGRALADGRALPLEQAIAVALAQGAASAGVAADSSPRDATKRYGLTRREVEVLRLLAQGLTNREIADQLFISPKTASKHVGAILAKLGVSSSRGAAAEAIRLGLT